MEYFNQIQYRTTVTPNIVNIFEKCGIFQRSRELSMYTWNNNVNNAKI